MKRAYRLLLKQSIKYFLLICLAMFGFFLWRILWNLPDGVMYSGLIISGSIIVIAFVFDALSTKDIIPILTK